MLLCERNLKIQVNKCPVGANSCLQILPKTEQTPKVKCFRAAKIHHTQVGHEINLEGLSFFSLYNENVDKQLTKDHQE